MVRGTILFLLYVWFLTAVYNKLLEARFSWIVPNRLNLVSREQPAASSSHPEDLHRLLLPAELLAYHWYHWISSHCIRLVHLHITFEPLLFVHIFC